MSLKTRKVKDIVEELYATYNVVIPEHLEYNIVRGPEDVYVDLNRSSMMQVMSNLVNNAVKFTKEGSITMGWQCMEDNVVIFLEDTGIGIRKEDMDKLFISFERLEEEKNRNIEGTGLGMGIIRDIVENKHNGTLTFESEEGVGTTFTMTIPIKTK